MKFSDMKIYGTREDEGFIFVDIDFSQYAPQTSSTWCWLSFYHSREQTHASLSFRKLVFLPDYPRQN